MKFTLGLAVLAAVFLTGCGSSGQPESSESPAARISIDNLELCERPNLPDRLRCGSMKVDFERDDPSLGQIEIAFAVLPAKNSAAARRQGLLAIEGGPGYGSIGSAGLYNNLFGDVLEDRDLIVIDARGTGLSEAIDCPDLQRGTTSRDIGVAACAEQLGPRYSSYRTAAIVDDFDQVLEALGYETVQLYGDSYGTFAAQSLAFRHPERVERIALDSAYPVRGESAWYPSIWKTGIRSLGKACKRSPDCDWDALAKLEEFIRELRDGGYSTGPFLDYLAAAGYSPPESYDEINEIISAYLEGNTAPYFKAVRQVPDDSGHPAAYSIGLETTVSCNDYPMLWDKAATQEDRYPELLEEVKQYPKGTFKPFTNREIALSQTFLYLECLTAPHPSEFYEPAAEPDADAPDVPVLVVNGELDNVTSPEEGQMTADLFPNSKLVLLPNAGHTFPLSYPASPGAREIRDFLKQR